MIHAQRQAVDPIGWCAEAFEWASTYILSESDRNPFGSPIPCADHIAFTVLQSGRKMACVVLLPRGYVPAQFRLD